GTTDKIQQAQGQIDAIKEKMLDNIDKVLRRGEDLDLLVQKSEDVATISRDFQTGTRKLKRKMQLRLCCLVMALVYVIVFVVLVVVALICGISGRACIELFYPKQTV